MTHPTKLYFDKVSNEGRHGQTSNGEKILFNLKLISEEWFQKYTDTLVQQNNATIFLPTGRFISVITASFDVNEKSMMTFDLMNNEKGAKYFAEQSEGNDELFMNAFRQIKYKEDYNKFILVEGDVPND